MTRIAFSIILLSLASSVAVSAPIPEKMLTDSSAILCIYPSSLQEATKAVISSDDRWLKSLGCVLAETDLEAALISSPFTTDWDRPWQVRVKLPSGDGVTLWGDRTSFKQLNGRPLMELLRKMD